MARVSGTDFDVVVWEGGWEIAEKDKRHEKESELIPKFNFGNLEKIFFEISGRCNYKCIHCYNPVYENNDVSFLPSRDLIYSIDKLFEKYSCKRIQLTGGEPLLHPDLDSMLAVATDYFEYVELFTNGSLLNKKHSLLKNTTKRL